MIPDYRDPGGLRVGLSPLSTSFDEVDRGIAAVRELLGVTPDERARAARSGEAVDWERAPAPVPVVLTGRYVTVCGLEHAARAGAVRRAVRARGRRAVDLPDRRDAGHARRDGRPSSPGSSRTRPGDVRDLSRAAAAPRASPP